MGGGVSLDLLEQTAGVQLDRRDLPPETRNVSEWVRARLNRPVHGGDIVHDSGLRVLVRKVRRQQVLEAQVSRENGAPHGNGAAPTAE
jgi:hypothetical protein